MQYMMQQFNIYIVILINYLPICNEGKYTLDLPLKILRNKKWLNGIRELHTEYPRMVRRTS
mgnify:CR=1 FL=1